MPSDQVLSDPTPDDRQPWRDRVREVALDPEQPIIDAHHHLWRTPRRIRLEPYLPEALFADIESCGHNIVATIYVDAFANYHSDGPEQLRVVGETVFADRVAQRARRQGPSVAGVCAGIVANADLRLGAAVGEVLDAHAAASPRFRGIRHMAISDPDLQTGIAAGLLGDPAFREGFTALAARGLTFDAAVVQSQLADVVALARTFPETPIVLNHIGTPLAVGRYAGQPEEAFAEWRDGMAELAGCPNVTVKIGGLNMPFTGLGAGDAASEPLGSSGLAARQRRHVLTTIDLFGPRRCMFESNFPVDKWYTSYSVLWNGFKRLVADFGPDDRNALFADTAERVYALDIPRIVWTAEASGSADQPATAPNTQNLHEVVS